MNKKPKFRASGFHELSEDELEALAYSGELGRYFTIDETTGPFKLPPWSELAASAEPKQNEAQRIGVAKGLFDITDERPLDQEWQSMPDVGRKVWPDYSADTAAWATGQAQALRNRDVASLDWEHLADEILDVAKAEDRELGFRVSNLMMSLIKRDLMEISLGSAGARLIHEQRKLVAMQLARNPSLQKCLSQDAWLSRCWSAAIVTLGEQGHSVERLPDEPPREFSTFFNVSWTDTRQEGSL